MIFPIAGLFLVALGWSASPDPDYSGLKLGNRWTYSDGTVAMVDRVDSTKEGWKYRRVALQKCPRCKDQVPRPDTSWGLVRGDSVFQAGAEMNAQWSLAMVLPPKAGIRWVTDSAEHDTLGWVGKADAVLTSGIYPGCWRVTGNDSLELMIDKKAGLVHFHHRAVTIEVKAFQPGAGK